MQSDFETQDNRALDERSLITTIVQGNLTAFPELINRYQQLVGHIVFRMVLIPDERAEICQEVFIKVYQNLSKFRFQSRLSTWIGRITYNTCLNFLKKKKFTSFGSLDHGRPQTERDSNPDASWDQVSEGWLQNTERPDGIYETLERDEFLHHEIMHLPLPYRTVVTLYHLDELSIQEIGEIMSLPEGTIKSHLFRARRLLKDRLLKIYRQEELVR